MEIEAKLPLSPERAAALRARLGSPLEVQQQRDIYLKTAGLPVALRVRQAGDSACVTLKSGFEEVDGIRVREEIEPVIRPEDVPAWLTIFERLGLPAGLVVAKTRAVYEVEGVHVLLDAIEGLGEFVEIEAIEDSADAAVARLEHAIRVLGLDDLPRITDSYRELLQASLERS